MIQSFFGKTNINSEKGKSSTEKREKTMSGLLSMMDDTGEDRKVYVMYNEITGVQIECTEKFVQRWKDRGFTIVEVITIKKKAGD